MKYKQLSLADACRHLFDELKDEKGDVGIIALNKEGGICMEFNSERMHRAHRSSDGSSSVGIYRDDSSASYINA